MRLSENGTEILI